MKFPSSALGLLLTAALTPLVLAPKLHAANSENVSFERPDGAVVEGTMHWLDGEEPRPTVLLMHQAQQSRAEFDFLLEDLHGLGFHTLAIDLRGHGTSTKPEALDRAFFMKLFRDPDFAPPDIEAILKWLSQQPRVDASRLGAMGGSVGANLAYIATGAGWNVKTAVVLSGNAEAVTDLSAKVESFAPQSVLLLAADNDHGRDAYARQLYEQAAEPRHIEILKGSDAHGSTLLRDNPELRKLALEWLAKYLK